MIDDPEVDSGFSKFLPDASDLDVHRDIPRAAAAFASENGLEAKTVRKVLEGKFVRLSLFSPRAKTDEDDAEKRLVLDEDGQLKTVRRRNKREVSSMLDWNIAYLCYVDFNLLLFPERSTEMVRYRRRILQYFRMYKTEAVIEYDRQVRLKSQRGHRLLCSVHSFLFNDSLAPHRLPDSMICTTCGRRSHSRGEELPGCRLYP